MINYNHVPTNLNLDTKSASKALKAKVKYNIYINKIDENRNIENVVPFTESKFPYYK